MRLNDAGLLTVVLLLGVMLGVVGTVAVYNSVADRQAEAARRDFEEAVKNLQYDCDQKEAQLARYREEEENRRRAAEEAGGEEEPAPAAPKPTAAPGFGPPREY